ncbi:SDR family oxidoreductase [Streptomyces cacaoi]|uniref:SDR family oxidoreductase n=1 Tax=Streptomyces cacaoi TaxID=1898 RepID=UPI0011F38B79|nr:NAD(P)H-binding protein [Streptomyces cacaoi]
MTDTTGSSGISRSSVPTGRPVLVTGGTGTLGRPLVDALLAAGVPVRVMSRRPRARDDERPYEWARCDLATGVGLGAAVRGVRAIVHCATHPLKEETLVARVIEAARQTSGPPYPHPVPHLVYISIVGVDEVPFVYYRRKLAAERRIEGGELPWTILRATQFHDLVAGAVRSQRRLPAVLLPRGARFQPVEVREVAARLAALVQDEPAGRVPDMGGPEVRTAADLARAAQRALGLRQRIVGLPVPGRTGRALRAGRNLAPGHAVGKVTFEEYLGTAAPPR